VRIFGHRGAAGLAPENTLAAFSQACGLKVDGVEFDVLLSADGELVVYHDFELNPDITRNANGEWVTSRKPIKQIYLAELKRYDVGRLKPGSAYARRYPQQRPSDGLHIPTLDEVISQVKNECAPELQLLIEVKTSPESPEASSTPEQVVEPVVRVLRQRGFLNRSQLLSFDWRSLAYAGRVAPGLPRVYLSLLGLRLNNIQPGRPGASPWMNGIDIDDYAGSIPQAVHAAGGSIWAPYYKNLTAKDLEDARRLGMRVYVWTPDQPGDLRRMIDMGVDGIITNRPDILKSLLP
jgi:glycerophosphoryl diester phosphodiesterase